MKYSKNTFSRSVNRFLKLMKYSLKQGKLNYLRKEENGQLKRVSGSIGSLMDIVDMLFEGRGRMQREKEVKILCISSQ
uniref:Uncharacterized protein n=1 Tax=Piliocolobus tephrosceles TaxID=591936 RepID=A0A8C9I1Q3_9PRIM